MGLARCVWIFVVFLSVSCPALASPLTIVYTNDLHLHFDRLATIETAIAAEQTLGAPTLILDAGDAWHDFRRPIDAVWGADAMIEWMNRVGYTAMALGNHELYLGHGWVGELIAAADFPILSANVARSSGRTTPWQDAVRIHVGELDVRIIGLTTGELLPYLDDPWLTRSLPESAIRQWLATEAPADLTIALGHLSVDDAVRVAERVPGIDLFITGHSHERTDTVVRVGETAIVQAGAFAKAFGRLRVDVGPDGKVDILDHVLLPTEKTPSVPAQGLGQLLRVSLALAVSVFLMLL